jgi:tetratricopeptide (TPR) repeat protein
MKDQQNLSRTFKLTEFEITYDQLESKYQRRFSKETLAEVNEILKIIDSDPKTAIKRVKILLDQHPDNPMLKNHLSAAYSRAGQFEKAERIAIENYTKCPDYIFAKTNYAKIYLLHGKINQIPAIFNHNFNLKTLYPKRKIFHISEFLSFMEIMSVYFHKIGEQKTAIHYYDLMKRTDKHHPITKQTKKMIRPSLFSKVLRKISTITRASSQ